MTTAAWLYTTDARSAAVAATDRATLPTVGTSCPCTFQPLEDLRPSASRRWKRSGRHARRDIDHPQLELTGVSGVLWLVDGSTILQGWPPV